MEKKLYHCVAYYPELWDESFIDSDIRYMLQAGINCVRMGEFAWHRMEPRPDEIDISFFVRVADRLHENGIDIIMCTPTPTPPVWLTDGHPERLAVNYEGKRYIHGARQHVCTNNPEMRRRAAIITEAVAKAFAGHPGVIAWQLDNEMKAQTDECMCPECGKRWHEWLREKYGTVEALNEAWGTEIWSEYYDTFEQVVQPLHTTYPHNSSLQTQYRLFSRQMINEFAFMQARIIRRYSSAPITHDVHTNFALDAEALFKGLDFTSMNGYTDDNGYCKWLFDFDLYRGMRGDNRFFVTETSPNYSGNLDCMVRHHRPGFVEIEALGAYASGAFGFSYWHFRQHRAGCEQPHGALISAWNKPSTGFYQVKKVEKLRAAVEPCFTATEFRKPQIAMTYSSAARAYFMTERLLEGEDYSVRMLWLHGIMERSGLRRDILPEHTPLDGYKLLFTPFLPYVSEEYAERALEFVKKGGVWLIGPLTGIRTEQHTVNTDCCMGRLEKEAGITAEFFYPMSASGNRLRAFGLEAPACLHGAVCTALEGTETLGVTASDITDGYAFLTCRKSGKGHIAVLSALPQIGNAEGEKMLEEIFAYFAHLDGVDDTFTADPGVSVIMRRGEGRYKNVVTAINGTDRDGTYLLQYDGTDVITGKSVSAGRRRLRPFGYEVIAEERDCGEK